MSSNFLLTSRFITLKSDNLASKITVFTIYWGCICTLKPREECLFLFVDSDVLLPLGIHSDSQISFPCSWSDGDHKALGATTEERQPLVCEEMCFPDAHCSPAAILWFRLCNAILAPFPSVWMDVFFYCC